MLTPRWQSGFMVEGPGDPHGPFELVAAPTSGGMTHWWRDNGASGLPWHGPNRIDGTTRWSFPSLVLGTWGNLEVSCLGDGDAIAHFYRNPFGWQGPYYAFLRDRRRNYGIRTSRVGPPALIQGRFGDPGNFELVAPLDDGLIHLWRGPDPNSWSFGAVFGQGRRWSGAALIHSHFFGNLEVVATSGDRLHFMWRGRAGWQGPFELGLGRGRPGFIQSNFGARGNFEVVVPNPQGGLLHYWRDNQLTNLPWSRGTPFGFGSYEEATLMQGSFDRHLEVIARSGNVLDLYWRDRDPTWAWHGPFRFTGDGRIPFGSGPLPFRERMRVHFKVLEPVSVDAEFVTLRDYFADIGIRVERGTTEDLTADPTVDDLRDLDVGNCIFWGPFDSTTDEQDRLFARRSGVGTNELVLYYVRSLNGNFVGCATYPGGSPGAVVAVGGGQFVPAHELGHVLGLGHISDRRRLMNPMNDWIDLPPDLDEGEASWVFGSGYTERF